MPSVLRATRYDRTPFGATYVGRPTKWGNLFVIGQHGTRDEVVASYERHLVASGLIADIEELRGQDLACWCHTWDGMGENPRFCHADILLERANAV